MVKNSLTRRQFIGLSGFFAFSSILSAAKLKSKSTSKPNIILILTDDQGYGDTKLHNNPILSTPNIDKIAKEGVEFTRFYVEPVCAPTRASLMTGRYYYRTGVVHTSRGGAKMSGEEVTIAEILRDNGYITGIFGKWHLGDNYPMRPEDQGFEISLVHKGGGIGQVPDKPNSYFDPLLWFNGERYNGKGYCTDIFFNEALSFIEKNKERPFFIYLPTNTPHTPLEISEEYVQPFRESDISENTAKVYGMIKNIDDNVGKLFKSLKEHNLDENTAIFFISDNGANTERYNAGLRRRKSSNYEGGIRALSYIRWKNGIKAKQKTDKVAAHIDITPTVLDICDISIPDNIRFDGMSLLPLVQNQFTDAWPDRTIFLQCHRGLTPKMFQNCAAVTQDFKLVGYPGTFGQENFVLPESPSLELYNIEEDPGEQKNLAEKFPTILKRLKSEYISWFKDVELSRKFNPGIIVVNPTLENPITLCRYQDSTYHLGLPHGWEVKVMESGKYNISIDRGPFIGLGTLNLKWQNEEQSSLLKENESAAQFFIDKGEGTLEIWFELDGIGRIAFSDNEAIGDVMLHKL